MTAMKVEYKVVPASWMLSGYEVQANIDDMRRLIPVCVCRSEVAASVIITSLRRLDQHTTEVLLTNLERDWDERGAQNTDAAFAAIARSQLRPETFAQLEKLVRIEAEKMSAE